MQRITGRVLHIASLIFRETDKRRIRVSCAGSAAVGDAGSEHIHASVAVEISGPDPKRSKKSAEDVHYYIVCRNLQRVFSGIVV